MLLVQFLTDGAVLPARSSAGAAGYDLSSSMDVLVPAHERRMVHTGLAVAVPPGTYGRVAPRSGLAVRHGIDVLAGVIHPDYRGALGVMLMNTSGTAFKVRAGDRIAQLVLERVETPGVRLVQELDSTERGEGGFGSTGVTALASPGRPETAPIELGPLA